MRHAALLLALARGPLWAAAVGLFAAYMVLVEEYETAFKAWRA